MKAPRLNVGGIVAFGIISIAIIAALESFVQSGNGGSLVMSMTFWLAIAQGCVALIAAAEVCRAHWHEPIKAQMLSAHPMILVIAVMFVTFIPQMDIYPWWGNSAFWANKGLFIGRHFVWMILTFFVARKFAAEALKGTDASRRYAVFYLVMFALGQTLVGLEWVMSLEKPWFSTLFGAYFIVESFQSGIALTGIALFFYRKRFDDQFRFAQRSVGGLLFGFSIFWVYFYFSQLIVIWYGNIPEEVAYLAKRIGYHTPYWAIARLIFGMCWVVPFVVLMGKKPKRTPGVVATIAVIILAGFFAEKWLMISPVVPVRTYLLVVETLLLGFLFVTVMNSGSSVLPRVRPGAVAATSSRQSEQHDPV